MFKQMENVGLRLRILTLAWKYVMFQVLYTQVLIHTHVDSLYQGLHNTNNLEHSSHNHTCIRIALGVQGKGSTRIERIIGKEGGNAFQLDDCCLYAAFK